MILSSRVQYKLMHIQGEINNDKNLSQIMSDSSTKVKQSARDPMFKGSKQADASAGSKKTEKIGLK
jgi:hypothetical protein